MHFGATLRLLRLDSGLSLRDLAHRLEVSNAYLSRVENGLDAAPTPARLAVVARELGLPPPLLMELAQRVSPLLVEYVETVPEAGSLFLEIAHRRLKASQIAELRAFVNQRFPLPGTASPASPPELVQLLQPERVVVHLRCSGMDDVQDMAAGRLADVCPGGSAAALAAMLKAREAETSSAIGGGVAVPCAYVAGAKLAAALVTLEAPLTYDTPDGLPLRLVIVLAGPRNSPERRLAIAQIARLAARGLADELATAASPAEVLCRLAVSGGAAG